MKPTYADSGVDVRAVRAMQGRINALIGSTANEHTPQFLAGHYAGVFEAGGQKMTMHCDGVGSKILVAEALGRHNTIGIDAVAMNANDIICLGSTPIVGVDYLALSRADDALVEEIMKGLISGCRESGIALIGGETAILPDMIKGAKGSEGADAGGAGKGRNGPTTSYDLAMTVVGTLQSEPLTGAKIKPGDALVGLESSGLHSNGFTLARKLLSVTDWGEQMLVPTTLYVKPVLEMLRAHSSSVHGIAHITGGAFSKLSRIGQYAKVGFELDDMPKPEGLFAELEKKVGEPRELYRTFNMGIGMAVACAPQEAEKLMKTAKKHGINSSIIGRVVKEEGVTLVQQGRKISLM